MNKLIYVIVAIAVIAAIALTLSSCENKTENVATQPTQDIKTLSTFSGAKGGGGYQSFCCSGGLFGNVWYDENCNGIRDPGELPIVSVPMVLKDSLGNIVATFTSSWDGSWGWGVCPGKYIVEIQTPAGFTPSPANAPGSTPDNDSQTSPYIARSGCIPDSSIDFGFCHITPPSGPCTRTPGYWKTHASKWPVKVITIGGYTYTRDQAIYFMSQPDGDKRYTMFRHLVSTELNLLRGSNSSCLGQTVSLADQWMAQYAGAGLQKGPPVSGSSSAWAVGEPLAGELDNYNNGVLCAPHCD